MNFCENLLILNVLLIVKIIIRILCIIVPLILIVMIILDLIKSITADKDNLDKAMAAILRRFLTALIVFLIPALVRGIFNFLPQTDIGVVACWNNATSAKIDDLKQAKNNK